MNFISDYQGLQGQDDTLLSEKIEKLKKISEDK